MRMIAEIHLTLKEMNKRLKKIETAVKNHTLNANENNDTLIAQFLPLTTTENIKEFDILLKTTDEAQTQFVSFYII